MKRRPPSLDKTSLRSTAEALASAHPILADALEIGGPPKLWKRPLTFATFTRVILEQQVSLASAWTTYQRLADAIAPSAVNAENVSRLGVDRLRAMGFSRQKARYVDVFATRCVEGHFRIGGLRFLDDDSARERIVGELGMGDWTADIIMMLALLRTDPFPVGDLALMKGLRQLAGVDSLTPDQAIELAEPWRPNRAVAARMIWAAYLRGRPIPGQD